jgi:hypothetical protein
MHSTESYTLCNLDSQTYSVHDHHHSNIQHHHLHPHQLQQHQQLVQLQQQQQQQTGHHQHYGDSSHRLLHYPDRLATEYALFGNNNDCFRTDWTSPGSAAAAYAGPISGNGSHVIDPDVKRCYVDVLNGGIQTNGIGHGGTSYGQHIDVQHGSNMTSSSALRCPPSGSTAGPFVYPSVAGTTSVFDASTQQQQQSALRQSPSSMSMSTSALVNGGGNASCLQSSSCTSPLSAAASSSSIYGQFYSAATGGGGDQMPCGGSSGPVPGLSRPSADYGSLSDSLLGGGLGSPSSGVPHGGQSVSVMAAAVAAVAPLFYPVNYGPDTSPTSVVGQHQMQQTDVTCGMGFRPSSILQQSQQQQQCPVGHHQLQRPGSPSDMQQSHQQPGHVTSQSGTTGTTGTATYKWMTVKRGAPKCSGKFKVQTSLHSSKCYSNCRYSSLIVG